MADQQQLDLLQASVSDWNAWREQNNDVIIDLEEADLRNTNLIKANLSRAILINANLTGAILRNTTLGEANLSFANLHYADLRNADLRSTTLINATLNGAILSFADLNGANLRNATLSFAIFSFADLTGADLNEATIGGTTFGDQDLREIKGLETLQHAGPSALSINTIYQSEGDIPEGFVKKTGAPDSFIEYMHALTNQPIQYYTCFISYSSKDQAFAERLYADLQSQHVRCWYAPEDMKIGDKIRPRIDESIRLYDKLLVVLSQSSVTSRWVEHEVETAMGKELEGVPNVLFPVRLDNTILESKAGWASHIRLMRHIGDFERWKDHDEYQKSIQRLLRDLKAEK